MAGRLAPLSPAPSANGRVHAARIGEDDADMAGLQHVTARGEGLHLLADVGSQFHASMEDDLAVSRPTYPTPKHEYQQASWEPSRGHGVDDYASSRAHVLAGGQARNPYTPEESPPLVSEAVAARDERNLRKRPAPSKSGVLGKSSIQKPVKKRKGQDTSTILPKPLSEIARDFPEIAVADVVAFASRSTAERQETTTGKVKRPLNAFMLYRKAYQKVAMAYCGSSSHQTVSQACGSSWRCLEPEHVRKKFKDLADTETLKHKEAHPSYKYVPKKAGFGADAGPLNPWDVEDGEYGGRGASKRASKATRAPKIQYRRESPLPPIQEAYSHPVDPRTLGYAMPQQREPGPYWATLPALQPLQTPYPAGPLSYSNPPTYHQPDLGFWEGQAAHPWMAAVPSWPEQQVRTAEVCVDPRLAFEGVPGEHSGGSTERGPLTTADYEGSIPDAMPDLDEHGAHNAYLKGGMDDWHVEPLHTAGHTDHFYEASYTDDWGFQGEVNFYDT